jgi:hypothetical protein
MIEHDLTAHDLSDAILLDLVAQVDPIGVISIYVDGEAAARSRVPAIEVRNALSDLLRTLEETSPAAEVESVRIALQRSARAIDRLVDGRTPGRGRALFIAVDAPQQTWFSSQLPVSTRVVIDASPFIHPLLETLEAGRPAGVVVVDGGAAELLDWRLGETRRVASVELEPRPALQRTGPVIANPGRGQQATPTREQRASRERDGQLRWLHGLAAEAFRCYEERGWQRLVIFGDERLTTPLIDGLPRRMRDVSFVDRRQVFLADHTELHALLRNRLVEEQEHRHRSLVQRVRDAALGAGRAVLGLSEVAVALNEARVEHLVYDPGVRHMGSVGANGWLYAGGEASGTVLAEQRLTERLVERCLATGAEITPVVRPAADMLVDADGVGA